MKENFEYSHYLGYVKKICGLLPGVGMIKGFCTALLIGELVEVLNSLMHPKEDWAPDFNRLGSRSEAFGKRMQPGSSQNLSNYQVQSNTIMEAENEDDNNADSVMSFEEESKSRPKPSQSFKKQNRSDFSSLMSGF